MSYIELPTNRRKEKLDVAREELPFNPDDYVSDAAWLKAGCGLLKWVASRTITGITITCAVYNVNVSAISAPTDSSGDVPFVAGVSTTAQGGSDTEMFAGTFILPDSYLTYCDEDVWGLRKGESRARAFYSTDTPTGTPFEFEFTPTGLNAVNVAIGRDSLYEIVIGDSGHSHLSVKLLGEKSNGVAVLDGDFMVVASSGRANMGFKISRTSPTTVRIEEEFLSETNLRLRIEINGQIFYSGDILAINHKKSKHVYVGLLDPGRGENETGIYAPNLRICNKDAFVPVDEGL